jgi:guanylate kinase
VIQGSLFIISAPSGTGKSTILQGLLEALPGVAFSVSHTTRDPRPGERDGVDYHFVGRDEFAAMCDRRNFLEWAEVHGNFYGTSKEAVTGQLARGIDLILDIDVQGARQVRAQQEWPMISVFIAPPSWEELERRLTTRNTDAAATIRLRLKNARREMAAVDDYDYVVVNDKLEEAVDALRAVIIAERSRHRRSPAGQSLVLPAV